MYDQIAQTLYGESFARGMRSQNNGSIRVNGYLMNADDADYYHNLLFAPDWHESDYDGWLDEAYYDAYLPSHSGGTPVKTWWNQARRHTGLEYDQRRKAKDRTIDSAWSRQQPCDKGASHPKSVRRRAVRYGRQHATWRNHFEPNDLQERDEIIIDAFLTFDQ